MRKHLPTCLLALTLSGVASVFPQTFEVRVVQTLAAGADTVHFEIRRTGTTSLVLSTASFLLNYNSSALGPPTVAAGYEGPWDSRNDQDYRELRSIPINPIDTAAGFAGLLVEFAGGHDNNGPSVPASFTRMGALAFPVRNQNLNSGFSWRNIGINTQVTRLTNPGSGGETDITASGVFLPPAEEPLPVQLAGFTGTVLDGRRVRLDWVTLSEINNYGFEAQVSPNTPVSYHTVPNSFIPGHGTTNEPHTYFFVDTMASPGHWLYRLRQIDLNGDVHYTEGIQVRVLTGLAEKSLPGEFLLEQNYPNPFNPLTRISYGIPREACVQLEVYNLLGQPVAVLVNEVKQPGYYTVTFDASGLGSGSYFYRLTAGQVRFIKRMVAVK